MRLSVSNRHVLSSVSPPPCSLRRRRCPKRRDAAVASAKREGYVNAGFLLFKSKGESRDSAANQGQFTYKHDLQSGLMYHTRVSVNSTRKSTYDPDYERIIIPLRSLFTQPACSAPPPLLHILQFSLLRRPD